MLTLQSKGNVDEAIVLMQKALEIDEKCEFAYETLGTVGMYYCTVAHCFRFIPVHKFVIKLFEL